METAHANTREPSHCSAFLIEVSYVPIGKSKYNASRFPYEIECKDTTILRGGKIYFAQRLIKKKAALVGTAWQPLLLWDF